MRQLSLFAIIFIQVIVHSQTVSTVTGTDGYWTGSFIKNGNSTQHFTVEFYQEGDSTKALFNIPDWAYYDGLRSTVEQTGRVVNFNSYYGELVLVLDSAYAEMVGECDFAKVHMKKSLRPPQLSLTTEERSFNLGDIKVQGIITRPSGKGPFPTIIIVHGRGCGGKDVWDKRPEVLAQYGIAVVTFDKRGHERTGFPCEETNMRQHAKDLAEITEQVRKMKISSEVGYLAYSAGGWVAPLAASETDVDFITSIVGPSTSVRQQQLDCSVYYVRDRLGLDQQAVDEAVRYCELEFSDDDPQKIFSEMQSLLDSAEVNGWIDVLEPSDMVGTAAGLDSLWVRRNRYDPKDDLQSFDGPFLAVLGGDDFVVPYVENSTRYQQIFEEVGKSNYRVRIIPSAGHGMEHWHSMRDLKFEPTIKKWHTYFKFDRVAPGALDELVSFLREYDYID